MINLQKIINKDFNITIEDCFCDNRYYLYLNYKKNKISIFASDNYDKIKTYYKLLQIDDKIGKIIKRKYKIIKIKQKLKLESEHIEEEIGTFFFEKLLKIDLKCKLDKELL